MEVLGRDAAREGYRIALAGPDGRVVGLLPEAVIGRGMLTGGRGHQTAYDWIAAHAREIETNLKALRAGRAARPPFDRMELVEEE